MNKKMNQKVENLKGKLIVSCQALPDEPLHSSFIMGRMALAAKQGGASGIRANTKGLGRLWIEGLRTDQLLLPKVGLPVSQLLAGTIVVISAILIIAGRKKAAAS